MKSYQQMTKQELQEEYDAVLSKYNKIKGEGLSLDMSRGKPGADQLDLAMPLLDALSSHDILKADNGMDVRNYGLLDGLPEAKKLFADLLCVGPENVIVGGNSSLNMMYDNIARSMTFGVMGETPWAKQEKLKFLCPAPGYDRHFAICETFGIEMINITMNNDGPDMDMVEKLVNEDATIKGMWCVPMYANPMGITYSDKVVERIAALKPKAKDFRVYWDNAYCVHHLSDTPDKLKNIFEAAKKHGNENMIFEFASTSKISFSGAGVAVMAASVENLNFVRKYLNIQTICSDKINQLRHVKYFKDINGIAEHMKKHQAILAPKFATVINALDKEIAPLEIADYTRPNGGYFISFNTLNGCAKRVGTLCAEAGVKLTPVGATFPYGKDENNCNIRIAPTFPPVCELEKAVELFCLCVKLASLESIQARG